MKPTQQQLAENNFPASGRITLEAVGYREPKEHEQYWDERKKRVQRAFTDMFRKCIILEPVAERECSCKNT